MPILITFTVLYNSIDVFLLFLVIYFLCVCCVYMFMLVHMYMYACLCVEARGQPALDDFLNCSPPHPVIQCLLWNLRLTRLARLTGLWSSGINLSLTPFCKHGSYRHTSFYTGAGDPNSCLCAYVAGTIPTELSLGHRFSIISLIFSSSWDPIHLSRPSSYKNDPN